MVKLPTNLQIHLNLPTETSSLRVADLVLIKKSTEYLHKYLSTHFFKIIYVFNFNKKNYIKKFNHKYM